VAAAGSAALNLTGAVVTFDALHTGGRTWTGWQARRKATTSPSLAIGEHRERGRVDALGRPAPGDTGDQPAGDARREQGVAAGDHTDGADQVLGLDVFDKEPAGSGADRFEDVLVCLEGGPVIGVSLAASLLGWLLLAVLDQRTPRARAAWTGTALVVLAASLALPLSAATTTAATIGLMVMHVAVAAVVIPAMGAAGRTR
jgi:Family of unknown function (DUF6069)